MYDNPHMDSYLSDEQDGELGQGLGSIHAFGGLGLEDDMGNDGKALLGPSKRKVGLLAVDFKPLDFRPLDFSSLQGSKQGEV